MNNDLISRSALLETLHHLNDEPEDMMSDEYFEWDNMCAADMLNKVLEIVEAFSSIDAKPVRHGRWIYDPNANDWNIGGYVCSECHTRNNNLPCNEIANTLIYAGSKFCPHCGARIDEETDDDHRHDHQ